MQIKSFSVDVSSEADILKTIGVLKSVLGDLRAKETGKSRADNQREVFEACCKIIETDISHIYADQTLDTAPRYYVYAHLDTSKKIAFEKEGKTTFAATLGMDYIPFYIGKGTGNRQADVNRNETHRKVRERLALFDLKPKVIIIRDGLTELEALMLESKLIDIFGLIPNRGRLTNLDEGLRKEDRRKCYQPQMDRISRLHRNSCLTRR